MIINRDSIAAPLLADIVDRRRGSIYDRIRCDAGELLSRRITLFQEPIGPNRSFAETNMYRSCSFDPPMDMIVERFLFLFQPSITDADRNRFLAAYNWEFQVLDKLMGREPLIRAAAVGKPEDLIPDFGKPRNTLEGEGSTIGLIAKAACWNLESYEIYIPPLMHFQVVLTADMDIQVQTPFDMYVMVEGLRDYPV